MSLAVSDYNEKERSAKLELSFQEIRAFSPAPMEITGFPTRVDDDSQIISYMDWNDGDGTAVRFERNAFFPVRALRTTFTKEEVALARAVSDAVAQITNKSAGRAMRPIGSMIDMFGLFRIIKAMKAAAGLSQISVFEAGPGNGYLGALLALSGERYASIDNAQAFYLWQNRLLEACAPNEFWDWAEKGRPAAMPRVQHVPWWDYVKLREDSPFQVDVFVSDCNLAEMSRYGFKYTTRIARRLLGESTVGRFLYVSTGNPVNASAEGVERELQRSGFRRISSKLFHCFSCRSAPGPDEGKLDNEIPLFGNGETTDTAGLLKASGVDAASLPFDIDFLSFVGFENHFVDHPAFRELIQGK
jgi:hypothetical protein